MDRRFHEQESALYNDLLGLRQLCDDQRGMSGGSPKASLEASFSFWTGKSNSYGATREEGVSGRWRYLWRPPSIKQRYAACLLTVGQFSLGIFNDVLDNLHFTGVDRHGTGYCSTQW